MSDSKAFQKTLSELKIKPKDAAEREELYQLLTYILCYPSTEEAEIHHRAWNIGTNDLISRQKQIQEIVHRKKAVIQTCQCCGVLAQNQRLPFCTSLKQLNLGIGVYLFFNNYLFHVLVFTLMFLIYSLFALITNIKSYDQNLTKEFVCIFSSTVNGGCGLSPIGAGSKVLYRNETTNYYSQVQSWLGVGFVSLWGLLYIIKTHTQQKFIYEMERKRVQSSDFTLMLTHIPRSLLVHDVKLKSLVDSASTNSYKQKYEEKKSTVDTLQSADELKKNFNVLFMNYGRKIESNFSYEVIKVNVAKPLWKKNQQDIEYEEKRNKKTNEKLQKMRKLIYQKQQNNKFKLTAAQREKLYEDYMAFCAEELEKENARTVNLADDNVVFVTLRSSDARREIQERNQPASISNFWNLCKKSDFPIKGAKVRRAPHPEEIKWQCIGFPLTSKRLRRLSMWILTIILIGISLGISIGISFINSDSLNVGVSVGISIVVTAVNIGIQIVIAFTSYYENEYISSREQSVTALKIGLGQLVNSIGVPIIVTLISQAGTTSMKQKKWLKPGGLVDDVFFIAALNVLVPLAIFLDPWELYLRLVRWWHSKPKNRLKIHGQTKLNKFYGNYQFEIGYQYAYLIKTTIFSSFFVCMQPIIAVFAPIGLGLYYLGTKRNLLYHFQRPNFHFATINTSVDYMLLISMIAFGFGCLLTNNFIQKELEYEDNGTLLSNWIIVAIAVGFLFVVPLKIFYCCIKKPLPPQHDYLDKRMMLSTDYDRLNPETKKYAIAEFKSYLEDLYEKQELPDEAEFLRLTFNNRYNQDRSDKAQNQAVLVNASRLGTNAAKRMSGSESKFNDNIEEYREIAQSYEIQKNPHVNSSQDLNSKDKL